MDQFQLIECRYCNQQSTLGNGHLVCSHMFPHLHHHHHHHRGLHHHHHDDHGTNWCAPCEGRWTEAKDLHPTSSRNAPGSSLSHFLSYHIILFQLPYNAQQQKYIFILIFFIIVFAPPSPVYDELGWKMKSRFSTSSSSPLPSSSSSSSSSPPSSPSS